MTPIVDKVLKLKEDHSLSKHEQLVQGVLWGIEDGTLPIGEKLPSINMMVREIGYARKTIVKAYEELKDRGLIESVKLKGYYVVGQDTNIKIRVALLLFAFQSFQEDFYNTFRNSLDDNYQIDVFFHHDNISLFETITSNIIGKYGMYVIAPIQGKTVPHILKRIPADRLLLVDRYLYLGQSYSFVCQEFEEATYSCLLELLPDISTYEKMVLFFDNEHDYSPVGIKKAFHRFLSEYEIEGTTMNRYVHGTLKKNTLYFIKDDSMLWYFLKECVEKNYELGKDLGILSFDDNVSKQIVFGGITTISTNFNEMAKIAANFVKNKKKIQTILPLQLFRRNSV
ncbi:GntR family transcriptional regulator [Maribacter algicola]|uniref:GntR family transcriptional regulator n=1 Tax=Meishania litoralis TaxID=3434685 RepID=A0ACC7LHZ0_9FLAO